MATESDWKLDMRRAYNYAQGRRHWLRLLDCALQPGVQAVSVYRFGRWLKVRNKLLRLAAEPIYFVLSGLIKVLWGIELPRGAKIGAGLYIGHFGGIVVSSGAVLGRNCNLSQGITIGYSGKGVPVIGDNVYFGPGARVFGKISVGNNVKIGANAVVHKDVPDNAVIVLDPGYTILSHDGNPNPNQV
jgi:serine O-acetyltransferase